MAERLPFFHDFPSHKYTVAVGSEQFEVRLTFRARQASWYMDLWDADGNQVLAGKRLSPSSVPNLVVPAADGPRGAIWVVGEDPYARDELELWFLSAAELAESAPVEDDLLPVVRP